MLSPLQIAVWPSFRPDEPPRRRVALCTNAAATGCLPRRGRTSAGPRSAAKETASAEARYNSAVAFCPHCYALITAGDAVCPACGANLQGWYAKSYAARLILTLNHPLADVRMRAIIALGLRGQRSAESPLVECALRHPKDVVAGLEIINSLSLLKSEAARKHGLSRLARSHPARLIREAAHSALRKQKGAP